MCDYKIVRDDKGVLSVEVADKLAAEMLVATYVPDFEDQGLTFAEAYNLACERDEEAAAQLDTDASNAKNHKNYEAEDPTFTAMVNAALARAEEEDAAQAEQEYHFIVGTLLDVPAVGVAV